MTGEVLDLAVLGKLLSQKCGACKTPFMLGAEVRARFDATDERWHASLRCTVCTADWTPLARALQALDHRQGPRTAAAIAAPTIWDPRGT